MALASSWFQNDPVFQNAAANSPPMKKGDLGESVRILQQALIELGHPMPISTQKYGTPDGDYGVETKAQVEAFQKKNGLGGEADGRVGKNTLAKLDQKMVALGKPKPNFSPLGGGSAPVPAALSQLAKDCVAILRESAVKSMNFRYEYVWFSGSYLGRVADAIEAGRIRVNYESGLEGWAEYIPFNKVIQANQFNLSFDRPRQTPFLRSVIVHEAVHAYQDLEGRPLSKYTSEGMAFAAQAWFHHALMSHYAPPMELVADPEVAEVYRAAASELEDARSAKVGIVALHGAKIAGAMKGAGQYRRMAEFIPYDGVP